MAVAYLSEIGEQLANDILQLVFDKMNADEPHRDEIWDQYELHAEMTTVAAMARDKRAELVTLPDEPMTIPTF